MHLIRKAMKKRHLLPLLFLFTCHNIYGQTDLLNWKLSGRFHFDGVGYINSPDTLSHQLDVVDIRLGGKINMGDWYLNLDVSYSNNKVSIKDAFLQYSKHNNYFRAGHQYVFTGIDQPNSSNDMLLNATANIGSLMDNGRRLGLTYTRAVPHYYVTAGFFVGDDIHVRSTVRQGYSTVLRALWRPFNDEFCLFHIGVSGLFKVPNELKGTDYKNITFSNRGAVRTKSPDLHFLSINDAKKQIQCVAEFYGFKNKWMGIGEYYWTRVNRMNATAYRAHGGYVEGGYVLRGEHFGYDQVDAFPTLPTDRGSILLVARYNQSNMNDENAGLFAGNQKDFSIGLDYFYNKHISTRLNYSYVKLDEHSTIGEEKLHIIQCRLQFRF